MKRKIEFTTGEYYHIYNRGTDKREVFSTDEDYARFLRSLKEFNCSEPIGSLYEKYLREKKSTSERTSDVHKGHPMSMVAEPSTKLVDIICYCLNPNHYHLILKQLQDKGVEKFMQKMGNGYTKYYNRKNSRSGVLFQGPFKAVHVDTNEYFLYVSAYVNANHFIHGYGVQGTAQRTSDVHKGHPMSFESFERVSLKSALLENPWKYSSLPDYLGRRSGMLCDKFPIMEQFKGAREYKEFLFENALYLKEKKEMEKYILE